VHPPHVPPFPTRRSSDLAQGRLINLAAAEGHPPAVMDMSFANQALSAAYLAKHHEAMEKMVYSVPDAIDEEVARLKLAALHIQRSEEHTSELQSPDHLVC